MHSTVPLAPPASQVIVHSLQLQPIHCLQSNFHLHSIHFHNSPRQLTVSPIRRILQGNSNLQFINVPNLIKPDSVMHLLLRRTRIIKGQRVHTQPLRNTQRNIRILTSSFNTFRRLQLLIQGQVIRRQQVSRVMPLNMNTNSHLSQNSSERHRRHTSHTRRQTRNRSNGRNSHVISVRNTTKSLQHRSRIFSLLMSTSRHRRNSHLPRAATTPNRRRQRHTTSMHTRRQSRLQCSTTRRHRQRPVQRIRHRRTSQNRRHIRRNRSNA